MLTAAIDWNASTYEAVCRRHRWVVPDRLNVAHAACERWADGSGRLALVEAELGEDGGWTWRRHTFDEVASLAARFASALGDLGVGAGDRVAVFGPQRLETAVAHLAAFWRGAVSVPLSPLFRADALAYRLAASGAKVVVTDGEHHPYVADAFDAMKSELPRVVCCDPAPPGTESWRHLVADAAAAPTADTRASDPATIVFTSGTSGKPKGALHAHRFLPGRLPAFELVHALEREPSLDRPFWTPADWAWVGGLFDCVFTPWTFGCPVLAFRHRGFDPAVAFELIRAARVRSLFLPPTAVGRMRRVEPPQGLDVLSVHTAGEPLPADSYRWAASTFGRVFELYGMTEMGAMVGNSPFFEVRPGAMGKPYPGHDVVLLDGERVVDGPGEAEIAVRRDDPGLFLGYWNDPAGTAARFRGDFFVTGDLARRDEDGYLWYVGRNDDVFNSAGYRIGPTEIEDTLATHPAVLEAAIVGAPDPDRGHVIKAFVVVTPDRQPGGDLARDIQQFVKGKLAAYEYPRHVEFVDALPRTVTGKIRRRALRERGSE